MSEQRDYLHNPAQAERSAPEERGRKHQLQGTVLLVHDRRR